MLPYQKDGYTGLRCLLSGKWVCMNDLCSLSFDIARNGRLHFEEDGVMPGIGKYICSLCGYNTFIQKDIPMNFCPRCGAKMGETDCGMKRKSINTYLAAFKIALLVDKLLFCVHSRRCALISH